MNMEQNQEQVSDVSVSTEIYENLEEKELEEYKGLKTVLRDVMSKGSLWSPEFEMWMDVHLQSFGPLGKAIEAIGKWREKKSSKKTKEYLEHYFSVLGQVLKTAGGQCPAPIERWAREADPAVLKEVGEIMDYAGFTYITFTNNRDFKEMAKKGLI